MDNKILEIIKKYPNGIHVQEIYNNLQTNDSNLSYSKIANRISEMYSKRGVLERIEKGIYKIK